jgi:hypothetical protein
MRTAHSLSRFKSMLSQTDLSLLLIGGAFSTLKCCVHIITLGLAQELINLPARPHHRLSL